MESKEAKPRQPVGTTKVRSHPKSEDTREKKKKSKGVAKPSVQVGEGGTLYSGSDRYPCKVAGVERKGQRIMVTTGSLKKNADGTQEFVARSALTQCFTRRSPGCYKRMGEGGRHASTLVLGPQEYFLDPRF